MTTARNGLTAAGCNFYEYFFIKQFRQLYNIERVLNTDGASRTVPISSVPAFCGQGSCSEVPHADKNPFFDNISAVTELFSSPAVKIPQGEILPFRTIDPDFHDIFNTLYK